jgi:hypothetical protein
MTALPIQLSKKPPSYINTLDSLKHLNWKTLKLKNPQKLNGNNSTSKRKIG